MEYYRIKISSFDDKVDHARGRLANSFCSFLYTFNSKLDASPLCCPKKKRNYMEHCKCEIVYGLTVHSDRGRVVFTRVFMKPGVV